MTDFKGYVKLSAHVRRAALWCKWSCYKANFVYTKYRTSM